MNTSGAGSKERVGLNSSMGAAIVLAAAMLLSAYLISSGLQSFGESLERSANGIAQGMARQSNGVLRVDLDGDLGGGSRPLRVEVDNK